MSLWANRPPKSSPALLLTTGSAQTENSHRTPSSRRIQPYAPARVAALIGFAVVFFLGIGGRAGQVWAQSAPTEATATWTFADLTGTDPREAQPLQLLGYAPTVDLRFTLPPGWQPDGDGQMALTYRISEFVRTDARVTVRVNDQNVASLDFDTSAGTGAGTGAGTALVTLPQAALRPGDNLLTFAGLLPFVDDEECIVPNHPARWLEFAADSTVAIPAVHSGNAVTLAAFPQQFQPLGGPGQGTLTFVMADEPDDDELSALAAVAFALARRLPAEMPWTVQTMSEFSPGATPGPAILLVTGEGADMPAAGGDADGAAGGWLSLTYPTWAQGYPVLMVGGADGAGMLAAADALVDQRRVVQMTGTTATVEPVAARTPVTPTDSVTLGDLGYGERVARGNGEQSLIYAFDLPFAWSMRDSALGLRIVHSPLIDPAVGSLTVLVNGLTVGGLRLDAPESAINEVPLLLPERMLRPGRNFLRLTFDFGTPERLCRGAQADDGPWASVRPDTALTFNHGNDGARLDLNDYPFLFAEASDLANLTLMLPADWTQDEATSMVAIVRSLSMSQNLARYAPRVASAPTETTGHLILLGEPARQPDLAARNPYLPVPFDLETGALVSLQGIRVPVDAPDLGVLQAMRGVNAPQQAIMVVSGTSAVGYSLAQRMVGDPRWSEFLAGQLTVTAPGTTDEPIVYTQAIADVASVPVVGPLDTMLSRLLALGDPWRIVIPVGAAAVVAVIAYMLFGAQQRRRRARSSGAH